MFTRREGLMRGLILCAGWSVLWTSACNQRIEMPRVEVPKNAGAGKSAGTPEEAVKFLEEAMVAKDADAFQAQIRGLQLAMWEVARAADALHAALEEKFGKDTTPKKPKTVVMSAKMGLANASVTTKIEIRSKDADGPDRVNMTVWEYRKLGDQETITQKPLSCFKDPTGWKLDWPMHFSVKSEPGKNGNEKPNLTVLSGSLDDKSTENDRRDFVSLKQAWERVVQEVRAGKYENREAVHAEMIRIDREIRQKRETERETDG
jgi:hypothetical protein